MNAGKQSLEPNTLMCDMDDDELARLVYRALDCVPMASGVNNHMGSLATSTPRVADVVARCLRGRRGPTGHQLFLVDSLTVPAKVHSCLREAALRFNVPFRTRDVFLDDDPNPRVMSRQAQQAIRLAKSHGEAIIIGHAKRETLEWLQANVQLFEKAGVTVLGMDKLVFGT